MDDLYLEGRTSGDLPPDDEDGEDDGSGSGSGDYSKKNQCLCYLFIYLLIVIFIDGSYFFCNLAGKGFFCSLRKLTSNGFKKKAFKSYFECSLLKLSLTNLSL